MSRGDDTAYPVIIPASDGGGHTRGMTIREAFAMAAMEALIENESSLMAAGVMADEKGIRVGEMVGRLARSYADDTLAELEKPPSDIA